MQTIDPQEIAKFEEMAERWWDESGPFAPLHRINPLRISYILEQLGRNGTPPLRGVSILDIGCGGGLLSVPLARLGASVTGVDASQKNIGIANTHLRNMAEAGALDINFRADTAEDMAARGEEFDVVLAMEVIEHVANPSLFMQSVCDMVRPGGTLIASTMNKTPKSYMLAIIGAEYIMRWLPKGTHKWADFVPPADLAQMMERGGMEISSLKGMTYQPFSRRWSIGDDVSVNYLITGRKDGQSAK